MGNGFDLGHGLKTNFEDFIQTKPHELESKYSDLKSGENSWAEIESNYKNVLNTCLKSLDIPFVVSDEMISIIDNYGLNEYGDVDYHGYENELFKSAICEIDRWVKLLCEFEIEFAQYLMARYNDYNIETKFAPKVEIQKILDCANDILSFNYTNTAEKLYGVKDVVHIHGNIYDKVFLGCDSIDMLRTVFVDGQYHSSDSFEKSKYGLQELMGYYEEDENYNLHPKGAYVRFFDEIMLETQDSVRELKDLFERKSKDGLPLRQEVIKKLKREHYDEVIILGHSLSDVDKLVLDAINKDAKFVCYYYDKPDYDRKRTEIEKLKWSCELIASDKLYL